MLYQKFKKKIEKVPIKTLPKTQLEMIYQYAKKKNQNWRCEEGHKNSRNKIEILISNFQKR